MFCCLLLILIMYILLSLASPSIITVCYIFSGAGKFCLANGLRQLKVMSVIYKSHLRSVMKISECRRSDFDIIQR